MTFNPNIPDSGQSPGLFPAQCSTNFTRLQTLINAEHVFNNSAGANDGVHRQSTYVSRADPTILPAGTNGMVYFASNRLKGYDGVFTYYLPAVLCSVTFNNTGAVEGTSTNVASVVRNSQGSFTITFTNPLPSTNGQWFTSAYSSTSVTGYNCGLALWNTLEATVLIQNAATGSFIDPALASVTFFYGYP